MTEREGTTPAAIVDAMLGLDPLGELPRTGWVLRGVASPETIAAHVFGVTVVTMFLVDALRDAGETVDGERALRMALLHDAAEARTGDVPLPLPNATYRFFTRCSSAAVCARISASAGSA